MLHILRDVGVHRPVRLQAHQVRCHAQHVAKVQEWLFCQLYKTFLKNCLGGADELLVAGFVRWAPALNLAKRECLVTVVIKVAPGVVEDAVERIARHHLEVVFTALAGSCKEGIKHEGGCDDGGSAIELKSILLINISAPAGLVAFLKNFYGMALGCKAHRRCQPAKSAADHNDFVVQFALFDTIV